MQRWFRAFLQGRWFRGSNRRWWAGMVEASVAAALFLTGVVLLSINLTLLVMGGLDGRWTYLALQLLLSVTLIVLGGGWIARLLWHVGVSAERRGAFAARANELEILQELRKHRTDLPTVPRDRLLPTPGRVLAFRITPSPRNVVGMITAAVFSIITVSLMTILALVCVRSFQIELGWMDPLNELGQRIAPSELHALPQRPWLALGLLLAIGPAAGWSVYHFMRQLLKLAGVGPTSVELSRYPLAPGSQCQLFLTQVGRVRLKLLDVELVCQEEATFNEGTDIRTEKAIVYRQRLLRRRGVTLSSGTPFEEELSLEIPSSAMHSFKSPNNRIRWKILVVAKARNWPRLRRAFPISVHPILQQASPTHWPEPPDDAEEDEHDTPAD